METPGLTFGIQRIIFPHQVVPISNSTNSLANRPQQSPLHGLLIRPRLTTKDNNGVNFLQGHVFDPTPRPREL
jgi:hypothetical protein